MLAILSLCKCVLECDDFLYVYHGGLSFYIHIHAACFIKYLLYIHTWVQKHVWVLEITLVRTLVCVFVCVYVCVCVPAPEAIKTLFT